MRSTRIHTRMPWGESCNSSASVRSASSARGNSLRSKKEIRSRLLNKLGIFEKSAKVSAGPSSTIRGRTDRIDTLETTRVQSNPCRISCRPQLKDIVPLREPLKYSSPDGVGMSPSSLKKRMERKQRQVIVFDDTVSVVPIPMRNEYSNRVRQRLWSNRYEIHENAARNSLEFLAEGCNWRNATEDEGMYVCSTSGELIHPVHCQVYYVHQQQQQQVERDRDHSQSFGHIPRGTPVQNVY